MRNRYHLLFSLTFLLICPRLGFGTTITAASLAAIDVRAAVNSALDGDIVILPAGSATWTSNVTVSGKSITIQGAGIDLTTITNNIPGGGRVLYLNISGGKFITLSGITFKQTTTYGYGIVGVGTANCNGNPLVSFRIHHCKFNGNPGGTGNYTLHVGGCFGLIDHCTFTQTTGNGGMISLDRDNTMSMVNTYHTPQFLGDQNCVCIEDCTFNALTTNDSVLDYGAGQKATFRHNIVYNAEVGNHGYDSQNRSARSFEFYQNTFAITGAAPGFPPFRCRGGTGVIWGNTITGFTKFFDLDYFAAGTPPVFPTRPTAMAPSAAWGSTAAGGGPGLIAEAGSLMTGSLGVDGNQSGPGNIDKGYPALDQPGRGSFPVGNPGNWPHVTTGYTNANYEALDPVYQWNNNLNGNTSPVTGTGVPGTQNYVKPNRDYYDNVQKPGYTPLVYPHPLTQGGNPVAPTNLHVVQGP